MTLAAICQACAGVPALHWGPLGGCLCNVSDVPVFPQAGCRQEVVDAVTPQALGLWGGLLANDTVKCSAVCYVHCRRWSQSVMAGHASAGPAALHQTGGSEASSSWCLSILMS